MARTEPFDAAIHTVPLGASSISTFSKRMGLRLGASPGLLGETSARLLCWPTLFLDYRQKHCRDALPGSVHVVQRCASWNLQAAPARTESRPTLYLACPSQIADATSGKAFSLREIRDAPILQKADAASLVADPEATFGHRGDD